MSLAIPTPGEQLLEILLLGMIVSGPVILFVFRRHFAAAPGRFGFLRGLLVVWTVLAAPILAGYTLIIVVGGVEAVGTLWALLRRAW